MFAALAKLAAGQFGVVAREQLLALGVSATTITRWVSEGRLVRLYRGVYAVGHANLTASGRRMAAVLACGPGAVLSHLTAAAHLGLLHYSGASIHISLPSHRKVRAQGRIRVHHTRLHPGDRAIEGIPVTSPMRTLLDLAGIVSEPRLREAVERSQRMQVFDRRELDFLVADSQGRTGVRALRRLLADLGDVAPEFRSHAERAFYELVRSSGLPLPQMNVVVAGLTVDAYWPEHNLVVEIDGYSYHRSRRVFEDDHARTERLQQAGLEVRRFTAKRVLGHPEATVAAMTQVLRGLGGLGAAAAA